MTTTTTNPIDNKAILFSILRDAENNVVESRTLQTPQGEAVGLNASLVELSTGDWVVLDKSFEGNYLIYIFDGDEDAARFCYSRIVEQMVETESVEDES